jgi:signal transduction histidine kinase
VPHSTDVLLRKTDPSGGVLDSPSRSGRETLGILRQVQRVEALGAMAAGVAHEVSNLLTIVLGSLDQLRRQDLDEPGRQQLARAEWGARQAGRLTRQVLRSVNSDAHDDLVDLNTVLAEFINLTKHAVGDGITLVVEAAPEPLPARLDPGHLELALLNLVRNAAFAMSGRGQVVLRTSAHMAPDGIGEKPTVEVSVSDRGTGMPPEFVRRATDPFFTTKSNQGTGLGLWIVQRFVAEFGGKIQIVTAVGLGTTVRLVFPRYEVG